MLFQILVKQSLAYLVRDINTNKEQEEQLTQIWLQRTAGFSELVKKHYPMNAIEKQLVHHLCSERMLQLEAIQTAMNNFLDAVYP